jgi:hypothetical protein
LLAATAGVGVALLLVYQHVQTGDALLSPRAVYAVPGDATPPPGLALGNPDAVFHPWLTFRLGLLHYTPMWLAELCLWTFPLVVPLVILKVATRPRGWDALMLWVVIATVLGYTLHLGSGTDRYGPRYYFTALPCICLLAARGIDRLRDVLSRRLAWAVPAVPYLFALGAVINFGLLFREHATSAHRVAAARAELFRSAQQRLAEPAIVFVDSGVPEANSYFARNAPDFAGRVLFARYTTDDAARDVIASAFPERKGYVLRFRLDRGVPAAGSMVLTRVEPTDTPIAVSDRRATNQ